MAESLGEHTFARQLAPLRSEPSADAEQVTQALPGEPLRVLEDRVEWVLVETSYAYPGWARREDLAGEPDAEWLRPVAADPVEHACTLLGTRYEWGGMTSAGIDCSGLVHMSFRACGCLVPRDADQQEEAGERLSAAGLRAGDLVTYGPPEGADHVAFWLGRDRILHSTRREGVDGVVGRNTGEGVVTCGVTWLGVGGETRTEGADGVGREGWMRTEGVDGAGRWIETLLQFVHFVHLLQLRQLFQLLQLRQLLQLCQYLAMRPSSSNVLSGRARCGSIVSSILSGGAPVSSPPVSSTNILRLPERSLKMRRNEVGLPRIACSMRPPTVSMRIPETVAPDSSTDISASRSEIFEKSIAASKLVSTMMARRPAGLAARRIYSLAS